MTETSTANRTFFATIPVADVARSTAFFEALGFVFDPAFASEGSACFNISEHTRVMLLARDTFAQISHLPVGDPTKEMLATYTFGVDSKEAVDAVGAAALAAGGREADGAEDHGFMYTRSFFDLDGHGWQVMWMDPAAAQPAPQDEVAASA